MILVKITIKTNLTYVEGNGNEPENYNKPLFEMFVNTSVREPDLVSTCPFIIMKSW